MNNLLLIITGSWIALPLLVILICNLLDRKTGKTWALPAAIVVSIGQMITTGLGLLQLWLTKSGFINFTIFWNVNDFAEIARNAWSSAFFSVDTLSLVVMFAIGMVALVAALTAKKMNQDKALNFTNLLMVLIMGMNGLAMVMDLFSLYVFLEITGIASFILIALYKDKKGLEGSFKYLIMSAMASAMILAGIAIMNTVASGVTFNHISSIFTAGVSLDAFHSISLVLLVAGIAIKAGLAPFHGWLPDAYESAPASVSVLLGGIVTKMAGVYAILRLAQDVFANAKGFNYSLLLLATVSIVYGAVAALKQKDFKRILAYSSISQIGYIVLGAVCGSPLGFVGAILHFFNHATFKSTLFVNSAALESQVKTRNIEEMGGLAKQMPLTGVSSVLALLSTAGIPPLAGFWSKLLIIIAVWQTGHSLIAGIAVFASVFTLAYFLMIQRKVFFGPAEEKFAGVREVKGGLAVSQVMLSVVTVVMGIIFPLVLLFFQTRGMI